MNDAKTIPDLMTPQEAALLLGVTSHQVRHLIRHKRLKAKLYGRFYLIDKKDLSFITHERTPRKCGIGNKNI